MEEVMNQLFTIDPAIRAMVGDDGVHPIERPQGSKLPAITWLRAGGTRDYDMEGATGLVESRFLVQCWGEASGKVSAYKQAKTLLRLVVNRLTPAGGFRETIGTTEIQGIFINNEDDTRTEGATGLGVARVYLDCTIWHKET